MAGLSTAANAFSVVGLADIVFRLGVNTASLYSRYRNASKDIASLVNEIQAFVKTVARIRLYLDEYHQSPYTQGDGQTLPPHLSETLSDCEKVLQDLQQLADKNKIEPRDGLAIQVMKSWRWTLQNEHVSKCCARICHLKTNLQTFLVFIGRENDIVLRKELKAAREDISSSASGMHQALHTMNSDLNSNQERTNQLLRNHTTLINQMIQQSENHHSSIESNINSKHEKSNALVLSQTILINQMIKMTEDHHQELLERIPNLTLEHTDDDDFIFQGENLGSIVLPLLLMKSDLFKTIKTLQKEGVLKVSRSEADWILQHFDNLLARGHEAAAKGLKGRPQIERTKPLPRLMNGRVQENISEDTKFAAFNQIGRIKHTSTLYTPSGVLILQTGSSNKPFKRHQDSADLQVIRLAFFPKPEFSTVNLSMLMTNDFGRNVEPQIPRLIQTYNTISDKSETWKSIYKLIIHDDARGLENVFKDGRGSPNDIFESGLSLSIIAAYEQSIAVCEFLFREGASTSPIGRKGQSTSLLDIIWAGSLHRKISVRARLPNLMTALQLANLAIKHGCDPNMVSMSEQYNMIHSFIAIQNPTLGIQKEYHNHHLSTDRCRDLFSSMVGMGCELEGRDHLGRTAFLFACVQPQTNMIVALIDIGADANATANGGEGALHLLMIGDMHHPNGDFYRGLVMLLTNKVDPNHLNDKGLSPSEYACTSSTRLNTWIEAVKHAQYKFITIAIKRVKCGHEEDILIVVSPGFELSGNSTLPISNMTLDEWLKKRAERRFPPGCPGCHKNDIQNALEEGPTPNEQSRVDSRSD